MEDEAIALLKSIASDLKIIRQQSTELVMSLRNAESEVPEKMRRFVNYMHDIHDIKFIYEELGHPVPHHVNRELERCDDRYRQLLAELHLDGGTFERVRREMANDPHNRWDHTRQLAKPNGESK